MGPTSKYVQSSLMILIVNVGRSVRVHPTKKGKTVKMFSPLSTRLFLTAKAGGLPVCSKTVRQRFSSTCYRMSVVHMFTDSCVMLFMFTGVR